MKPIPCLLLTLLTGLLPLIPCGQAQSSSISFQGQLGDAGRPANGNYDFRFRLFDQTVNGAEKGVVVQADSLGVTNGFFVVGLDFGLSAYTNGGSRWVQVEVKPAGAAGAYAAITPRTAMTAVPFALYALSGNPGPKGDAGAQGPAGATGLTGVNGPQGPQGAVGVTGATGTQGPQGPQGTMGATGARGLTFRGAWSSAASYAADDAVLHSGAAWLAKQANANVAPTEGANWTLLVAKGDAGVTGAAGPTGAQGAQGLVGAAGLTGATGPQGPQGATGVTGATGTQGPQGPQGTVGATGARGLTFRGAWSSAASYAADDAVLHSGAAWLAKQANANVTPTEGANWTLLVAKGDTGVTGAAGPTGAQGPQGLAGSPGPQGAIGLTGSAGPQGPQGPAGVADTATLANLAQLNVPDTAAQATATAQVTAGFITAVTITFQGNGYTTLPQITVTDSTGSGAVLTPIVSGTKVIGITVSNPGSGYTSPAVSVAVPQAYRSQTFQGDNTFTGNNLFFGSFTGSGAGLTNFQGHVPSGGVALNQSGTWTNTLGVKRVFLNRARQLTQPSTICSGWA